MVGGKIAGEYLFIQQHRPLHQGLGGLALGALLRHGDEALHHILKPLEVLEDELAVMVRRLGELADHPADIHPVPGGGAQAQGVALQQLPGGLPGHGLDAGALRPNVQAHGILQTHVGNGQQHLHVIVGVAVPPQPHIQLVQAEQLVRPA